MPIDPGRLLGRTGLAALALSLAWGLPASAQDQDNSGPMSAIDWLSDSVQLPVTVAPPDEPDVTEGAAPADVTVTAIGRPVLDAVGLLPASMTGLPADLWGASTPGDLARRIRAEDPDMLPSLRALLDLLLLAELDPPVAPDPEGNTLFLARVDKLLDMGALDQAEALLARSDLTDPDAFRRWFDVTLLLGTENQACALMQDTPALSPTFPARIFCLSRSGDWAGATLLLGTGRALDLITAEEDALIARFLDPDLFEGEPPLPQPARPTPLTFRMFEAIGEPIPTATLHLAFAQADLRANIGWRARISAGERLARTGAVGANQLIGLYTERQPAASGGIWTRAAGVQALEDALATGDRDALTDLLPRLWRDLASVEVEAPIAKAHGAELAALNLPGDAGRIAFRMGLLSDAYESVANAATPADETDRLLIALARGLTAGAPAPDNRARAVLAGFAATQYPSRLVGLIETDRLGEALLRAMDLFTSGTAGDLDEITDAVALLRLVGLEETARRAALEYLILERRG